MEQKPKVAARSWHVSLIPEKGLRPIALSR